MLREVRSYYSSHESVSLQLPGDLLRKHVSPALLLLKRVEIVAVDVLGAQQPNNPEIVHFKEWVHKMSETLVQLRDRILPATLPGLRVLIEGIQSSVKEPIRSAFKDFSESPGVTEVRIREVYQLLGALEGALVHPKCSLFRQYYGGYTQDVNAVRSFENVTAFQQLLQDFSLSRRGFETSCEVVFVEGDLAFAQLLEEHLKCVVGDNVSLQCLGSTVSHQTKRFSIFVYSPTSSQRISDVDLSKDTNIVAVLSSQPRGAAKKFLDFRKPRHYFISFIQLLRQLYLMEELDPEFQTFLRRAQGLKNPKFPVTDLPLQFDLGTIGALNTPVIEKCIDAFRESYAEQGSIRRFFEGTPSPISESYVRVAVLLQQEQVTRECRLMARSGYPSPYEELYNPKQLIELSDLFSEIKGDARIPDRILLWGRAGSGKTTLCQFLANRWAVLSVEERITQIGSWTQKYQFLVWVPLRALLKECYREQCRFGEFLQRELLPKSRLSPYLIEAVLEEQEGRVLYLLDGYDEVSSLDNSAAKVLLESLLGKQNYILTSRPHFLHPSQLGNCRHLEHLGFMDPDVDRFVDQFFVGDIEKAASLKQFMSTCPSVNALAHVPIVAELVCHHWKCRGHRSQMENLTITQLYELISSDLFRRYLADSNLEILEAYEIYNLEQVKSLKASLEEIAWRAMQQKQLTFGPTVHRPVMAQNFPPQDRLHAYRSLSTAVGFLKGIRGEKNLAEEEYYFIHLTFQEYFAAGFFADCILHNKPLDNQGTTWIEFIRRNKYDNRFLLLFRFTAGKLKSHPEALDAFLIALVEESPTLLRIHELAIAANCLEEFQIHRPTDTQLKIIQGVSDYLSVIMNSGFYGYQQFMVLHGFHGLQRVFSCGIGKALALDCARHDSKSTFFLQGWGLKSPDVVEETIKQLGSTDYEVLARAIRRLAEIPYCDERVVNRLLWIIENWNFNFACRAAEGLKVLAAEHPLVSERVLHLVRSANPNQCYIGVHVTRIIGYLDKCFLEEIMRHLRSSHKKIQEASFSYISALRVTDTRLLDLLLAITGDEKSHLYSNVMQFLCKHFSGNERVIRMVIGCLQDPVEHRRHSAGAYMHMLNLTVLSQSELLQIMQNPDIDQRAREACLETLSTTIEVQAFIQKCTELVYSDLSLCKKALVLLRDKTPEGWLNTVAQMLSDSECVCRIRIIEYLGDIEFQHSDLIPIFIRLLVDEDRSVRDATVFSLAKIKPQDQGVVSRLVACIEDPDKHVHSCSIYALKEIGLDKDAICKRLLDSFENLDTHAKRSALALFGKFQSRDPRAQLYALQCIHHMGAEAQHTLYQIRSLHPLAIKEIITILRGKDLKQKLNILQLVYELEIEDSAIVEALVELIQSENIEICKNALQGLRNIKFQNPDIRSILVDLLKKIFRLRKSLSDKQSGISQEEYQNDQVGWCFTTRQNEMIPATVHDFQFPESDIPTLSRIECYKGVLDQVLENIVGYHIDVHITDVSFLRSILPFLVFNDIKIFMTIMAVVSRLYSLDTLLQAYEQQPSDWMARVLILAIYRHGAQVVFEEGIKPIEGVIFFPISEPKQLLLRNCLSELQSNEVQFLRQLGQDSLDSIGNDVLA